MLCIVPVKAQETATEWVSSASYTFRDSVDFELVGETAVLIEQISLIIDSPSLTNPISIVADSRKNENNLVHASGSVSPVALELLPFTTVVYWWEIEFEDEKVFIPAQSFVYKDDRLVWQSLDVEPWHIYWTGNDADLGSIGLQIAQESQSRLDAVLVTDDTLPVDVYIYPSFADMRAAFRLNGLREWAGKVTDPLPEVVMVTAVNPRTAASDLQQSIPYALTKFWLYQQTRGNYDALPFWLREGLAVGMVPEAMEKVALETAVNNQSTIPFSQLCDDFPTDGSDANPAVQQSVDFVQFLQTQYGDQTVQALVDAYANGAACDEGVAQVTGKPLNTVNQEWLKTVRSFPLVVQFVIDNSVWFLLILFMIVITGFLVWKI